MAMAIRPEAFIVTYNTHLAHPFEWRKGVRFYQRLKDRIGATSALHLGVRDGIRNWLVTAA